MSGSPLDPLRAVFGEQLESLAGAAISGEVPLTAPVVNRLIARQLASRNLPVVSAEVEPQDRDTFVVRVRPKGPLPVVTVDFRIDQQPELPGRPELGLRWALRGLGPLALLATPVLGLFKALPPGIRLEHDRLWVDLVAVLRQQGFAEVVPMLADVRVLTREGRFVIAFQLRR